ncbi:hypothetical protein ACP4OV_007495 [Aristida adscensionis]
MEKVKKLRRENEKRETMLLLLQVRAGHRPGLAGLTPEEVSRLGGMVAKYLQLPLVSLPPPPPAALQMLLASLPPALQLPLVSLPPVLYTIDVVGQTSQPQGWMMDMGGAGGDIGGVVYGGGHGSFVGGDAFGGGNLPLLGDGGTGTSAARGSMLQPSSSRVMQCWSIIRSSDIRASQPSKTS